MPSKSTSSNKVLVALATVFALMAAMFTIASPAQAANIGTIKVATDSVCSQISNQPKVSNPYWFAGFGFRANIAFTLVVETQPGATQLDPVLAGSTDSAGNFCVPAMQTPEGQYKVTYTGPDGKKSKVYKVQGDEATLVPIQPAAPTFLDPSCEYPQRAEVVLDTTLENVTYTVTGDQIPGGTVVVTATLSEGSEGYVLTGYPEDGWSHTFLATPECAIPPLRVEVEAPTFTDATCDATNATTMKIPADTDQIDYTAEPSTATPGVTVKVTAAPIGNVVLTGYPEGGWSHTFPTIASLNCPTPPPAAIPAPVTAPTFVDATCTAPAAMTIPVDTTQIDYTTVGTASPGTSVTVTAKPMGNVVLTGYPANGWSHTFAAVPTNCDSAVGGTEDTNAPTNESDSADDEAVVAGSEDELAATGGNVDPAVLGLLLLLSGAAFVTARRLALK